MDVRNVALDDLVLDPSLNLRDRLDDFTVERYAEAWERMPPITVFDVDQRWLLADGFHRHAAAVMLGKRTIPAELRAGTFNDALDFVAGVNLFHGLPLTRAERRRAVEVKLRLHHDWSDRRASEEMGVSRELVAKIRKQLIEAHQIPNNPGRIGADGKLYSTAGLPRDPNEHLPRDRQPDEAPQRGRGGKTASPPWEDDASSSSSSSSSSSRAAIATAEGSPFGNVSELQAFARQGPIEVTAPTVDELLDVMTKQIMEVLAWTRAEGFAEGYREASANARGVFHAAVIKLAARAEQLRRG